MAATRWAFAIEVAWLFICMIPGCAARRAAGGQGDRLVQLFGAELAETVGPICAGKGQPDRRLTRVGVLTTCAKALHWQLAVHLLAGLREARVEATTVLCNAAIGAYGAAAAAAESRNQPCSSTLWLQALALLGGMVGTSMELDVVSFIAAMGVCGSSREWARALALLHDMRPQRLEPTVIAYNAALRACEKASRWHSALGVLATMESARMVPDDISYNTAISACSQTAGLWEQAVACLGRMRASALEPCDITATTVASACERSRRIDAALRVVQDHLGGLPARSRPSPPPAAAPKAVVYFAHEPVMLDEVAAAFEASELAATPGAVLVDCTVGSGGHSQMLLERQPEARLLGIDVDPDAVEAATKRLARFGSRVHLAHGNYARLPELLEASGFVKPGAGLQQPCAGIFMDLGVSSPQLDRPARGFSLRAAGPLDMRFDPSDPELKPASWHLSQLSVEELQRVIERYGDDEPHARRIAEGLVRTMPQTTAMAAKVIQAVVREESGRTIHPATKTFQALRVLVNNESGSLRHLLSIAPQLLAPGGLLATISFQSLEDELVRQCIIGRLRGDRVDKARPGGRAARGTSPFVAVGSREGLRASRSEVLRNVRSRSAKLRLALRRP